MPKSHCPKQISAQRPSFHARRHRQPLPLHRPQPLLTLRPEQPRSPDIQLSGINILSVQIKVVFLQIEIK